jgi:hypothetical protein
MSLLYPASFLQFSNYLITFVTFDILPMDDLYEIIFGPDTSIPLTANFEAAGYGSRSSVYVMGS